MPNPYINQEIQRVHRGIRHHHNKLDPSNPKAHKGDAERAKAWAAIASLDERLKALVQAAHVVNGTKPLPKPAVRRETVVLGSGESVPVFQPRIVTSERKIRDRNTGKSRTVRVKENTFQGRHVFDEDGRFVDFVCTSPVLRCRPAVIAVDVRVYGVNKAQGSSWWRA